MRELETLIREIDAEIERAFEQTFEATAKNFEEMVEHLFRAGAARLRRVSLRPVREKSGPAASRRRRRRGRAGARGGGRGARGAGGRDRGQRGRQVDPQALAALRRREVAGGAGLRLAVFLARPCPFYILDEVEAALDDANIDRFLQLIRRYFDRAQFVIVTHQKRTMDAPTCSTGSAWAATEKKKRA